MCLFQLAFVSLCPRRAIQHVKEVLEPFSTAKGGPIQIDHVTFVEGRGNLILTYNPSGRKRTVAFVGSHLDVVPANPETWNYDPFKLTVEVGWGGGGLWRTGEEGG